VRRISPDDFVDAEPRQRGVRSASEDRLVWSACPTVFGQQFIEEFGRFFPERADAPLVPFAVQVHPWGWIEVNIGSAEKDAVGML
jgi:hypothetical protein